MPALMPHHICVSKDLFALFTLGKNRFFSSIENLEMTVRFSASFLCYHLAIGFFHNLAPHFVLSGSISGHGYKANYHNNLIY